MPAHSSLAADPVMMVWWGTRIECAVRLLRVHPLRAADSARKDGFTVVALV